MQNYIRLTNFSLLNVHYAFFDTSNHYADQIFMDKKIKVSFGKELQNPDEGYAVILCRVRKKDGAAFREAMADLERKMLLLGHSDYGDFCDRMSALLAQTEAKAGA